MNSLNFKIFLFLLVISYTNLFATEPVYTAIWNLNSLDTIGGHNVVVVGNPQLVKTDIGDAIQFDGNGDQILIDFNPIKDAKAFTVELVFKPDASYPNNTAPRFLHFQDPNDPEEKRVMIELRITENNECYMDGFIKTDIENLALIDEAYVHPTGVWQHVAITYNEGNFTTYFNGIKELTGTVKYSKEIINAIGKTSLGGRMDKRSYYAGLIKTLKVTHSVLEPQDFIFIN